MESMESGSSRRITTASLSRELLGRVSMAFGQHYWHCLFDFSSSFPVDKGGGRSFRTDISLYMETVQDLLDPSNDNISIVEDPKTGDVSLPGATTIEIRDQKSFVELLRLGPTLWIDMEVDKGLMFKI
nr:Kinesin-like protein KIN-UA [Ipomoea batatas]